MAKKPKKAKVKNYIREWRDHRGLSQEQLAGRVERSQETITRLENLRTDPSLSLLAAIAYALQCETEDLINGPPGYKHKIKEEIEALQPDTQRQALTIIRALKAAEKAA